MEKYTGIIKLEENGKVRLVDELGNPGPSLEGPFIMSITKDRLKIQVREQNHANHYIVHADVEYTQVEPAASVPFDPNTQTIEELFDLLDRNFFFDIADGGGGGAVTGAESGTFISGDKVRLGGPLLQNTSITEDGFDFTADREEDLYPGSPYYGSAITYYKSETGQPLPDVYPVTSLNRKIGAIAKNVDGVTIDSTAELGVFGDDYYDCVAYFKANETTREARFFATGSSARVEVLTGGALDNRLLLNTSFINLQAGNTSLLSMIKDGAISLSSLNGQIGLNSINNVIILEGGMVEARIKSLAVNYNVLANDHALIATAGGITFTLPLAIIGQVFEIYPNGNAITLSAGVGRTINGAASLALSGQGGTKVKYISANNYQTI